MSRAGRERGPDRERDLSGGLLPPSIAGFVLYHAFAVISGSVVTATSNAVPLTFLP